MEVLLVGKRTLEKGFQTSEPQQELKGLCRPFVSDLHLVYDKHNYPSIWFLVRWIALVYP